MQRTRGFTLVELIMTMAITAILLMMGIRSYSTWIVNARIRNVGEAIVSGMQLARAEAVRRNASVTLTMDNATATGWTVGCTAPVNANCPDATIQARSANEGGGAQVAATSVDAIGRVFTFNNLGRLTFPAVPGVTATCVTNACIDVDDPVVAAANPAATRDLRVQVGIGGQVRLCDPNAPLGNVFLCQ